MAHLDCFDTHGEISIKRLRILMGNGSMMQGYFIPEMEVERMKTMFVEIRKNTIQFENVPQDIASHIYFIVHSIKYQGLKILKHVCPNILNQQSFFLQIIEIHKPIKDICAAEPIFDYFPESMKTKSNILKAIHYNYQNIKGLDQYIDQEIIKRAIWKSGLSLYYLPDIWKKDKSIVKEAIYQHFDAIVHIDPSLKCDSFYIEMIQERIEINGKLIREIKSRDVNLWISISNRIENLIHYVPREIKENREFVIEYIRNFGAGIRFIDFHFLDDEKIILSSLNSYNYTLDHASKRIIEKQKFMFQLFRKNVNKMVQINQFQYFIRWVDTIKHVSYLLKRYIGWYRIQKIENKVNFRINYVDLPSHLESNDRSIFLLYNIGTTNR